MRTCPNPKCGAIRLVVEGKRKKCRKCGTPMTALPPKPAEPEKITVEQLAERYPQQAAEIVKAARDNVVREEIGELTTEILLEQYPDLVKELTTAAAKETAEAIAKKTAEKVRTKISEMSIKKFAEQFGGLYEKIVTDANKPDRKAPRPAKGETGQSNK